MLALFAVVAPTYIFGAFSTAAMFTSILVDFVVLLSGVGGALVVCLDTMMGSEIGSHAGVTHCVLLRFASFVSFCFGIHVDIIARDAQRK